MKCHSLDGTSSKAGPNLQSIGDKFPRRDLIQSVLEPSAVIAVGYGTTVVETKSGEEIQGVLKSATAESLELVGTDGRHVVPTRDIRSQHGTTVSLMPEGLETGMSPQEFADLIEFLTTLRQPETAVSANRGMPSDIPDRPRTGSNQSPGDGCERGWRSRCGGQLRTRDGSVSV